MIQYIALGLLIFSVGYPLVVQFLYVLRARFRNLTSPPAIYSYPFGIPQLVSIIKSVRGCYMNRRNYDVFQQTPNRLTVRLQLVSGFTTITLDPENLKALLSTQFKDFGHGKRHKYFFPLFGDGVFTLDGQGWQHTRAMLRPQFTREQISHVHIIEKHVQKIVNMYKQNDKACKAGAIPEVKGMDYPTDCEVSRKGEYVDIMPLFFKLTMDTATEFLFGESVGLLDGGNPKVTNAVEFGKAFNAAQEVLLKKVVLEKYYWAIGGKKFMDWCKTCQDFAMSYVELALERTKYNGANEEKKDGKNEPTYVFLDELAKETRDPIILRDQAINIMVAGRDTTASLLSWTLLMLARNKPVFHKLRAAILKELGDGSDISNITFESLKRCEYLRYVLNETLRLYPTVPNNFRYALKDTSLPRGGGKDGQSPIFIPKDAMVIYNVYSMHRNPTIWGNDALEFRPERWASNQGAATHSWNYLPFNGGPRICLGQQFALTEVGYTVCRLLQSFKDIEAHSSMLEPKEPRELASLTLSPADGVYIKLIS